MAEKRYSDADLQEFKQLIEEKLVTAREELSSYREQITKTGTLGNVAESKFNGLEDGAATQEREFLNKMAERQTSFINHLENALMRIQNKTYGICRETGNLISKERLKAVPHATLSIEAKKAQK